MTESSADEAAYENEMSEIYTSTQNYLELIRRDTPTPPIVEYAGRAGEVETNVYDEPVQELIIESESRESSPDYQAVPVKDLISTFEQGKSTAFTSRFRNFFFGFVNKIKFTDAQNNDFFNDSQFCNRHNLCCRFRAVKTFV